LNQPPPVPLPKSDDATVRALAKQTDTDLEEVRSLLDDEIATLYSTASVTNFIPLLARRRVKQKLRAKTHHIN
jgi:hypothetical protein